MLQSLHSSYPDLSLLVPGILCKLLHEHMNHDDTASLTVDAHLTCWSYDDTTGQSGAGAGGEGGRKRSIAFDGKFVYLTNTSLTRLLKIGTGTHGTIR